jgi:hypothetical protein
MNLKEIDYEDVIRIYVAEDRNQWYAFVYRAVSLLFP